MGMRKDEMKGKDGLKGGAKEFKTKDRIRGTKQGRRGSKNDRAEERNGKGKDKRM